jgi:hypothetical protein
MDENHPLSVISLFLLPITVVPARYLDISSPAMLASHAEPRISTLYKELSLGAHPVKRYPFQPPI